MASCIESRKLPNFLCIGAGRKMAGAALKSAKPLVNVVGKARLGLFAIAGYVDSKLRLPIDALAHRPGYRRPIGDFINGSPVQMGYHHALHIRLSRQATDMSCQDAPLAFVHGGHLFALTLLCPCECAQNQAGARIDFQIR